MIICTVLVFLFNSVGYYIIWELKKSMIRKEMQAWLQEHTDQLTVLTFHTPEALEMLRWVHEKEFIYNNQLFDVLKVVKQDHETIFFCKRDINEEKLNEGYRKLASSKLNQQLLEHLFTVALCEPLLELSQIPSDGFLFEPFTMHIPDVYIHPLNPPPKFFS